MSREVEELLRRFAAIGALGSGALAVVVAVVAVPGDVLRTLVVPVLVLVCVAAAWTAGTRRGPTRLVAAAVAVGAVVAAVALILTAENRGLGLAIVLVLLAASVSLSRFALRRDLRTLRASDVVGTPVGPARKGVLILNLKSGGGKAEQHDLPAVCEERGIEAVILEPGDDLLELARDAVERGADVIGMAGGDGSQALVASIAAEADVALVCVPAGTRNHFALDLGLDRDDVVGALDAFGPAVERRIDLAEVNGRTFVNNVSLGVYAKIVQSPGYRDAKRQTTATMLPELLGPDAEPFDLHFAGPDGEPVDGAQIIQVSNNPYVLTSIAGFGTRARLDTGRLGVAAAKVAGPADVAAFVAANAAGRLDRFEGWTAFEPETFAVTSDAPVEAGVDGEALVLDAPLEFRIEPAALRVRIPTHAFGRSPAARRSESLGWTLGALLDIVRGRPLSTVVGGEED